LPVGTEAGAGALHEAPKGASFSKKPAPPPRQTTRCQKCGGEISVGAKTCMHCWEKL
jgi:ribosomal protein S14